MSEQAAGEKTEQATEKKLQDAQKQGQIPRSQEVQTLFVLISGTLALIFAGGEMWRALIDSMYAVLGHLHELPVTSVAVQNYFTNGALLIGLVVAPVALTVMVGGVLAGGVQSRFQTSSEALAPKFEKLNPINGLKRIFSMNTLAPAVLAVIKISAIIGLSYGLIVQIIGDPIFYTQVQPARIAEFMASSALRLMTRLIIIMIIIAAADYAFQIWKHGKDLRMTKQEVKDENKNTEGDPQMKARMRSRRVTMGQRKMLMEVPHADVVITNPTHLAVAIRYDRGNMKAPRIVAKGARKFALKIRELAKQSGVPVIENKPVARMMYKHGKPGGEIPAQLYAAVAEILAYVYRTNRYRYWREMNQTPAAETTR